MSDPKPTRSQGDLAEMLEMLLDKGVVVNADVAVSVGDTELLGIELRAAIASFETAAKYGLEFPAGTDMERVETAAGVSSEGSGDLSTKFDTESAVGDTSKQPERASETVTDSTAETSPDESE
ncbi:gas-vesicle-associated protein GvpJ [Natronomonas moolapensis 8.8.11]|uniref:Gas-vesicle-associated protein GvpJ n=1 Tax=Natronomonas moolapensis (strain DSM 18674 / CECT 7526 / JCM 14361 / 8.8.11) TaxID=268739 RepID=M1XPI7_NATM8|nr:gas vesicle protein [Natronomonas moolapensis]CCQ35954.1 gas-vesicle-associated protein GvpJ [Natronomonas moolapensis 8.8.11]